MKSTTRLAGILGAACALFFAGSSVARAQDPEPREAHTLSFKLGAFTPTNGTLRNDSGTPYLALGVDYDPNLRFKLAGGNIVFGLDFLYRTSGGKKYLTIPITVKSLWNLTSMESRFHFYGGIGGGIYIINTGFIGATTQIGAKFIAGVDITQRIFAEVNYDYIGGFSDNLGRGVRADGITLWLGFRR
ncbi:MAG: hypothetical protein ABJA67_13420 [Chthonomonadales bacterium]